MKVKVTLTYELEYDLRPEYYPEDMSPEQMVELDVQNYSDMPEFIMDNEGTKRTVKGEIIDA